MNRLKIKIAGESGSGLLSIGNIIVDALNDIGFNVVADREYPSLIKGLPSCFIINAAIGEINSLSKETDVLLAIDKESLKYYFDDLKEGGILIHGYERLSGIENILKKAEGKNIKVVHLKARETAIAQGGKVLMSNTVLLGMLWKVIGCDPKFAELQLVKKFEDKQNLIEINVKCFKAGFENVEKILEIEYPQNVGEKIIIDGNYAIALGGINCGVRAYYAYPMSPASSILTHMAEMSEKTGVLVKQVEDEISTAQMVLGSMFMGTRAFTATSGGGYDLMTETVSLAGMIECPLVVVIAQRPGPATGLPTWTMQGDLNLACYSSHGEFTRLVISVSDSEDAFYLIQEAFNYAEEIQIPVIVLTEKYIAESKMSVPKFDIEKVPIKRGLVKKEELASLKNSDRYAITETGVSKRWLPGTADAYYFANGDEHLEDGSLTEESLDASEMYAKRMRKMDYLKSILPEPEIYGVEKDADISFVGWGSSKRAIKDVINLKNILGKKLNVNYLHFSYLFPLKEEKLKKFFEDNHNVHLIEGNYTGQFGEMVEKIGLKFKNKLLKFDGRLFFVEDAISYILKNV